jgi:hypothetical protein
MRQIDVHKLADEARFNRVGPLQAGDRIEGRVDDVGTITLTVGPAE